MGNLTSKVLGKSSTSASNKEVPAPPYHRASLLGLPTELRLMIYDIIKDSNIHHYLPHDFRHLPQPPPRLPLRDLARSCKLAREIRDHRQSLPANERHATISILVRSDNHNHDFYLSHAACPAKDLTILKLRYTALLSDYYWTDDFPTFRQFTHWLLEPSIPDGLPDALDVQVFCTSGRTRVPRLTKRNTSRRRRTLAGRWGIRMVHNSSCRRWNAWWGSPSSLGSSCQLQIEQLKSIVGKK